MNDSVKRGHPLSPQLDPDPVTQGEESSCNEASDPRCLALVTGAESRTRLYAALAGVANVTFFASVAEVLRELRADQRGVRAVILEARDAAGHPAAGLARQVTTLFPAIPVIGYCSGRSEDSQEIIALASAGVHELIYKQHDDHAPLLRAILARADQQCAGDLVLHHLRKALPRRLRPLVEYCLSNPEDAHAVNSVARALGVDRKTLVNHCKVEGFPPPGTVLGWCLLLLSAALLAAPGVPADRVALQLAFPSATALRNMLKRYTGMRPAELRTPTALAELCARFLELGVAPKAIA
jgi:AraC-type DNA-binding domain-containing proteins